MKSSLQTLQRIQKFNIDEQRRILAELQTNEERLQSGLERLNTEYEREKEFASAHPGTGDFGAYTKRYLQYREAFERQLAAVRAEIEKVRDKIADMFKEQKTFEIVDDNRQKRREKENNAKEQKTLDEIGTNAYIKRKKQ